MGSWSTGYTSIVGESACIVHSHRALWLLAPAGCCQSSPGDDLFEAKIPSEKMRWTRSLRGAECEIERANAALCALRQHTESVTARGPELVDSHPVARRGVKRLAMQLQRIPQHVVADRPGRVPHVAEALRDL